MKVNRTLNVLARSALAVALLAADPWIAVTARAAEKAEPGVVIPATVGEIWKAIDLQTRTLTALTEGGKLEEVHLHAFAIRDLVAALPVRSADLGPAKLGQIRADGKFVATLAARLDASGDAKDKAGTESNLRKLKAVLANLRSNYPASIVK